MGQQKGALKIKGTLGDITFAKTKDGFIVKEKSEQAREKFAKDPAYEKFRNNGAEFGRAGRAVKLIREAFKLELKFAKDRVLTSRLQKLMMQIVKSDPVSPRGMRTAESGDLSMLNLFEFNGIAQLNRSMAVDITASIDRATGELSVDVPEFVPTQRLLKPEGSTHYRLVCAASEIDFAAGTSKTVAASSGLLLIGSGIAPAITLSNLLTPNSTKALFLVFGIQYAEVMNGFTYPEVNGEYNALTILKVDMP